MHLTADLLYERIVVWRSPAFIDSQLRSWSGFAIKCITGSRMALSVLLSLIVMSTSLSALEFNISLQSLTAHNTSANPAYNMTTFPDNFGLDSFIDGNGGVVQVDPMLMDRSMNPTTPGHVSTVDVHTLIPSRPDLRWFAHLMPIYADPPQSWRLKVGVACNTDEWVSRMLSDLRQRGFDGVIIDWYMEPHPNKVANEVALLVQRHLREPSNKPLTFAIMIDQAKNREDLAAQVQYCENQFFGDPNYEREDGKPILMFFRVIGPNSIVRPEDMGAVKAAMKNASVWIPLMRSCLQYEWCDQVFQWACEPSAEGINANDRYNLSAIRSWVRDVSKFADKQVVAGLCPAFNGTLTKRTSWSLGKYLPSDGALCLVERAALLNDIIPAHATRMQWITWNDYEEGSAVEPGVENFVAVRAHLSGSRLEWSLEGREGKERTIDHFDIYASRDSRNLALLGKVGNTVSSFDLARWLEGFGGDVLQLYVNAVGKPCVRDHISKGVAFQSN